ncbi:MAG TPA: FAD-dependent oxidoreductase, partial [bacterium]|nr:FAD-dependent oxidoreductase [bacterium]
MERGTLIIGAGVVGLGIGWQLAKHGEPVTILERGQAGQEASWAAAGMLAPATEVHYQEDRNLQLGLESMRRYPEFVAEVEAAAGMDVDYRTEGALAVGLTADDAADLRALYDYQTGLGLPVRWLSAEAARELEPGLSSYVTAGVFCGMDHQVDNRLLVQALRQAFVLAGGTLLEGHEVTELRLRTGGPQRVLAAGQEFSAPRLLVAAGSWSALLPGLPEAIRPPVRPVKGQICAVRSPEPAFLRHMIRAPQVYLAPKSDGRLV